MNCPYCGKYDKYSYRVHAKTCRYNPEIIERLRVVLPNQNHPERICTWVEYRAVRERNPDIPSVETLRKQYGSWENLAKEFGLQDNDHNSVRIEEKANATKAALENLSIELYDGEYAPTQSDYKQNVLNAGRKGGPMTCEVLLQKYGNWTAVLRHFGITVGTKPYIARKKAEPVYTPVSIEQVREIRNVLGI